MNTAEEQGKRHRAPFITTLAMPSCNTRLVVFVVRFAARAAARPWFGTTASFAWPGDRLIVSFRRPHSSICMCTRKHVPMPCLQFPCLVYKTPRIFSVKICLSAYSYGRHTLVIRMRHTEYHAVRKYCSAF